MKLKFLVSVSVLALTVATVHADDMDDLLQAQRNTLITLTNTGAQTAAVQAEIANIEASLKTLRSAETSRTYLNNQENDVRALESTLSRRKGELDAEIRKLNDQFKEQAGLQEMIKATQAALDTKNSQITSASAAVETLKKQNVPASDQRMKDATATLQRHQEQAGKLQTRTLEYVDKAKAAGLEKFQAVNDELSRVNRDLKAVADTKQQVKDQKAKVDSTIVTARNDLTVRATNAQKAGTASYADMLAAKTPPPPPPVQAATTTLLTPIDPSKLLNPNQVNPLITDKGAGVIGQDAASLRLAAQALAGMDGASLDRLVKQALVGQDGGSLVGQDGASLRAAAQKLIGHDGATLVGQDGASLRAFVAKVISNDGAGVTAAAAAKIVAAGGGNAVDVARIVAAGGGNAIDAARIVAAGGGNAIDVARIVAAGGGNAIDAARIVAAGGGNAIDVARAQKFFSDNGSGLISKGGAGIMSENGAGLAASLASFSAASLKGGIATGQTNLELNPMQTLQRGVDGKLSTSEKGELKRLGDAINAGKATDVQKQRAADLVNKAMEDIVRIDPNLAARVVAHGDVLVANDKAKTALVAAVVTTAATTSNNPTLTAAVDKMKAGGQELSQAELGVIEKSMTRTVSTMPISADEKKKLVAVTTQEVKKTNAIVRQPVYTLSAFHKDGVDLGIKTAMAGLAGASPADQQKLREVKALTDRAAGPGLNRRDAEKLQGLLRSLPAAPAGDTRTAHGLSMVQGNAVGATGVSRDKPMLHEVLAVPAATPLGRSVRTAVAAPATAPAAPALSAVTPATAATPAAGPAPSAAKPATATRAVPAAKPGGATAAVTPAAQPTATAPAGTPAAKPAATDTRRHGHQHNRPSASNPAARDTTSRRAHQNARSATATPAGQPKVGTPGAAAPLKPATAATAATAPAAKPAAPVRTATPVAAPKPVTPAVTAPKPSALPAAPRMCNGKPC